MNERVRLQYLQAMGITMYVPRFVLPGAKPSPRAPMPQAQPALPPGQVVATIPRVRFAPPERAPNRTSEPVEVGRLVEVLRSEPPRQAPANPAPQPVSEEQKPADVRFALQIWQLSPDIMVIDSHQPRQGLPTTRLLMNMLFAIGRRAELPAPELLTWPLLPQLPAAPLHQAREMVASFLASRLQSAPVEHVWLLGRDALLACSDSDDDNEATRQITIPSLPVPALVMPSLADLLKRGELKADVWCLLRRIYRVH